MEVFWNDDHTKYAILGTNEYGAGWSTWNYPELAYDKRIVSYFLNHCENKEWMNWASRLHTAANHELTDFLSSLGYNDCYCGGWNHLSLIWIDSGRKWTIDEYDGREFIVFKDKVNWISF